MTNPYAATPLIAASVDPSTGRHVHATVFLGAAPRAVIAAARRARASRKDPRTPEWDSSDAAILHRHYGPTWRSLLSGADPRTTDGIPPMIVGGNDAPLAFEGDLAEFDTIGIEPPEVQSVLDGTEKTPAASYRGTQTQAPSLPTYSDIAIYPEDSIYDLRLKIAAAAGIPWWRAHFFYYVNEEGPVLPYRITVDGALDAPSWRELALSDHVAAVVAGLPVEPRFEERREGLRVEARDTFTRLVPTPGVRVTRAFCVDFDSVIKHEEVAAVLADRYQFDLLYYGAIVRFWPHLGPDAASLALGGTPLSQTYPALDPPPEVLLSRLAAERVVAERALAWRGATVTAPARAPHGRSTIAVTGATLRVAPAGIRVIASVRNISDWIPTSADLVAITAHYEAAGTRQRAIARTVTKRHASSFARDLAAAVGRFVARPPRLGVVAAAITRRTRGATPMTKTPFIVLSIRDSGHYEVSADWREDERVSFDDAVGEVAAVAAPVVAAVNAMGAAAFPIGGGLASGAEALGAKALGAITASAFWPHALSGAGFRELKARFREYERAGVVGIRGLQQVGAYTFAFRKGVVAYAAGGAGVASVGVMALSNQYAWLVDPAAAARWATMFGGRTVRVYHRATDLRVEIIGADDLAEFELIRRYIFSFLDSLLGTMRATMLVRPGAVSPAAPPDAALPPARRRLRRLQESDPNLFDLKKYDQNATVYSVLCQSGRQPRVYTEAEGQALGARRFAALSRYWNFTEDRPAFYECPDPKFPYLSYRAGIHPLGRFLPCCKKTRAAAGTRAAAVNAAAAALAVSMAKRRDTVGDAADVIPEDDASLASRHVLTYGKAIPAGRVSDPPRELAEGLFLGAVPPPYALLLVGVEQSVPAVPDAGFAYSLAYAMGDGDDTADDVFSALAALAGGLTDTYHALGGGAAAALSSSAALADAILGAFVRRDAGLLPFSPGGALGGHGAPGSGSAPWRAVLVELARLAFGIEVVVVGADATLEASAAAAAAIVGTGVCPTRISPRVAIIVESPGGTYPLAALNPRFYLRVPLPQRWMAARRSFADGEVVPCDDCEDAIQDRVVAAVRDALTSKNAAPPQCVIGSTASLESSAASLESSTAPLESSAASLESGAASLESSAASLESSTASLESGTAFSLEARLADPRGLCYGLVLRRARDSASVVLPTPYGPVPADDIPVQFGGRPGGRYPRDALLEACAAAEIPIAGRRPLVNAEGTVIGFTVGDLYYFHDPTAESSGLIPAEPVRFPYDPHEIDRALATVAAAGEDMSLGMSPIAAAALHRNRLYQFLVAEFASVLRADRAADVRRELTRAIRATVFSSPASVAKLRESIAATLEPWPADIPKVSELIARAYVDEPRDPGAAARAALKESTFGFDRHTLARLKGMAHDEIVGALRGILADKVTSKEVKTSSATAMPPSMYVACGETSSVGASQCVDGRLSISPDTLSNFLDILASDIKNENTLLFAATSGTFEPLDFIRRPGEFLVLSSA